MVVVDTDILISIIGGNKLAENIILKYAPKVCISVITEMELFVGATDNRKKEAVKEIVKNHGVIPLSKSIGEISQALIKTYNTPHRSLYLADALIAATCMEKVFSLLTFNTSDFKFIKGLKLAK